MDISVRYYPDNESQFEVRDDEIVFNDLTDDSFKDKIITILKTNDKYKDLHIIHNKGSVVMEDFNPFMQPSSKESQNKSDSRGGSSI